ncbi:hypothetical protein [Lysobacter sp.]|uniref:hypothetical protein n=1 Tax=Lysobacter sp. TaxID=72226 RepID=UPI002D25524D|nr:hypothetical protein [Lysobacter sp.]HZX78562.1 hypothetical protein [Lysobacter sp.]
MELSRYLTLMNFPAEWEAWDMLPRAFVSEQSALYELGHEEAAEHDRHGVFQWWLTQNPPTETLVKLVGLSWLDPDQVMAGAVRQCIARQPDLSKEVNSELQRPFSVR